MKYGLLITVSLVLLGCKKDGDGGFNPVSPFSLGAPLVTTSFTNYQAFTTYQADNDLEKACQTIALEEESEDFNISLQLFEDGIAYSCIASDDWRSQCFESGTYSGPVVRLPTDDGEIAVTLTKIDEKTVQTIAIAVDGQPVPLDQVFDDPNDTIGKVLSTPEIEALVVLNRDCKP